MADETRKMPKGGRKGGSIYPRIDLKRAIEYCHKLVSKTHTGPQPAAIVLAGVFGCAGGKGNVRVSALKQYGLLDGTPAAYNATALARAIVAAPPEELPTFLRRAFVGPKVFRMLFKTFCNDSVSSARIRQQVSNLKVHPDSLDDCVKLFTDSAIFARVATIDGESVTFVASDASVDTPPESGTETDEDTFEQDGTDKPKDGGNGSNDNFSESSDSAQNDKRAVVHSERARVEIKIDPLMDPDKLDKLLAILRRYGQI